MAVSEARDSVLILRADRFVRAAPQIVYVNPAFLRRTGYEADEVIGGTPDFLRGPQTDAETIEQIIAAVLGRVPFVTEVLHYRKDGSSYWCETSIAPTENSGTSSLYWIVIQRDITDRKATHELLTQARIAETQVTTLAVGAQRRQRFEEQLAVSVTHDGVTGLRNRRYLMLALRDAVARAAADSQAFALVSINIDRFRVLNAHFGNPAGNMILREVAKRLAQGVGSSSTVARIAGDEFMILLGPAESSDASGFAQAMLARFDEDITIGADTLHVPLSVGVTVFEDDRRDAETLLRDSGTAMHRAKREGGRRVVTFTQTMEADTANATSLAAELREALERREFYLDYQPIVDASGSRVAGFEALLRWKHPVRGLIPPLDFIPAAEEAGLIIPIGAWALERACSAAVGWQTLGGTPLTISVNVTSNQLLDASFLEHLQAALERTQLPPRLLQLEVTESVLLVGAAIVEPLFKSIRALGVKIAFDDFGTGYSSLSYLERFQIDTLKIDKSFVDRMNDTSAKSEIIRMIVALAHSLGLKVIAEGVEMQSQCDALCELGCTEMQGYLFSRPIPEADVAAHLQSNWETKPQLRALLDGTSNRFNYASLTGDERLELVQQVTQAIAMHHTWLTRLKQAAETGESPFSVATVSRDDLCSIGQWLSSGIATKLRASPLYVVTQARHAVFHRNAARLLSLALARDPRAGASLEAGGDFNMVAALMLSALQDWLAVATRR